MAADLRFRERGAAAEDVTGRDGVGGVPRRRERGTTGGDEWIAWGGEERGG